MQSFDAVSKGYQFTFTSDKLSNFVDSDSGRSSSLEVSEIQAPRPGVSRHQKMNIVSKSRVLGDEEDSLPLIPETDPSTSTPTSSVPTSPSPSEPPSPSLTTASVSQSMFPSRTQSPSPGLFRAQTPSPTPPPLRKRTMDEVRSASTPPSPEKKKTKPEARSAIHTALEGSQEGAPKGLMNFFQRCSREENEAQFRRFSAEHREYQESRGQMGVERKSLRDEQTREEARLRQEKHRKLKREREITAGERTPGGTKRKVCLHLLAQVPRS